MLDVRENFRNRYVNKETSTACPFGCDELDSQEHLIYCKYLNSQDISLENNQPTYRDLFSQILQKQLTIAMIIQKRYSKRKMLLQKMDRGEP